MDDKNLKCPYCNGKLELCNARINAYAPNYYLKCNECGFIGTIRFFEYGSINDLHGLYGKENNDVY